MGKKMEMANTKTVKDLQVGIEQEIRNFKTNGKEFNNSVKVLQRAIQAKSGEWQKYMSKGFNPAIIKMGEDVHALVMEWKEHMNTSFKPGIRKIHADIRQLRNSIEKKASKFQEYNVNFWG